MFENKKACDTNDVLSLIIKLLFIFAAIAAAVVTGLKIYEKIQSKRMYSLCNCCDDEYCDDDFCGCECDCDCESEDETSFAETVADVTEHEINPDQN